MLQDYLKTNPIPEFITSLVAKGIVVEIKRSPTNAGPAFHDHWAFVIEGFCKSGTGSVIHDAEGWKLLTRYGNVDKFETLEDLADLQLGWLSQSFYKGYGLHDGWRAIHSMLGNDNRVAAIEY
jgi:hypothetical protein